MVGENKFHAPTNARVSKMRICPLTQIIISHHKPNLSNFGLHWWLAISLAIKWHFY